MSNFAKNYAEATGKRAPEEKKEQTEEQRLQEELSVQARMDWIQHPVTEEFMHKLAEDERIAVDAAISFAVATKDVNHEVIVQLLVRVATIRQIRKSYATASPRT